LLSGNSTRHRAQFDIRETRARSAISNGSALLTGLDHRSAPARRFRDVINSLASDLGGADVLSEAQLQLVRSAAGLIVLRERLDLRALNDERVDTSEYARITNSLRRVLATLGLQRVPRDVTPSLSDYLKRKTEGD
jgi:hypothetical protein